MKQNHTGTLPPQTGDVWPCQIVISGNPNLPGRHPDGLRYRVLYPDGRTSLAFYRYYTARRLAEDYNASQTQ